MKLLVLRGIWTASRLTALLLTAFYLTACQPTLTPVARSTPQILTVETTPALQVLSETYKTCAEQTGNTGLVLLDTPTNTIDLERAPLALRWGAAGTMKNYAAVIGQEKLAIVVNPANSLTKISLTDLKAIYAGTLATWKESKPPAPIQPWAYTAGEDVQAVFETNLLGKTMAARTAWTAPNPSAMRKAIATLPDAIGFLPQRWVDASVKPLTVEGLDTNAMRQPILALSKSEPKGLEKSWLLCLQARLKE